MCENARDQTANDAAGDEAMKDWHALALGACTLWGNMLLLEPSAGPFPSIPFETRTVSMVFSIFGFMLTFALARTGRSIGSRTAVLAGSALVSCIASIVHFGGWDGLPFWVDTVAVAAFSVAFAVPLVACGEVYAGMAPRRAVVYACLSYLLAWLGCMVVATLPQPVLCLITSLMPLCVLALVVRARRGEPDSANNPPVAGAVDRTDPGVARTDLHAAVASAASCVSPRVLAALGIAYFALGNMWAQTASPADYYAPPAVIVAALTSFVIMGACLALVGRNALTVVYKALLVVQVLVAFLLFEQADFAQVTLVITLVGVKIVAWLLMTGYARAGTSDGVAPALTFSACFLSGHMGEGLGGLLRISGTVGESAMTIVVVLLLVVAAAFLFTAPSAPTVGTTASKTENELDLTDAAPVWNDTSSLASEPLETRIDRLAHAYLLSERETDVFRLWATGHSLKYVQDKLGLSLSTVKTHVSHIYAKTGKHSRAEIVALLDEERGSSPAR